MNALLCLFRSNTLLLLHLSNFLLEGEGDIIDESSLLVDGVGDVFHVILNELGLSGAVFHGLFDISLNVVAGTEINQNICIIFNDA